jgi:AraC-like DNA-binding protein
VVWDESRGIIVCTACATVLDQVYVTDGAYRDLEELRETKREGRSRNPRYRLCEMSVKYVELLEEVRLRQDLYIDEESFMRYVKLGKRVMSKYPRLCSRTDRAKYALAKVAYALATGGSIDIPKLSEELGLSKTHVKRLIKVVYSSGRFIDEVRRLVGGQVVPTYVK